MKVKILKKSLQKAELEIGGKYFLVYCNHSKKAFLENGRIFTEVYLFFSGFFFLNLLSIKFNLGWY